MFQENYYGWLIEILAEADGYIFHCWLPGNHLAVSDRQTYSTLAAAQTAAKHLANLESVKGAMRHCYTTYIQGSLSSEEFLTLEEIIHQVAIAEFGS